MQIFPGGMQPSASLLREQIASAGLTLDHEETFAESYARTLAVWLQRFEGSWDQIAGKGFTEQFRRK